MPAQVLNLVGEYKVEQGADFILTITVNDTLGAPYSLVGASAAAQIRETVDAVPKIAFTCSINEVTSVITISLTAVQTAGITYATGVWDCELTELGGVVTRLLEGDVDISPEVTRA